MTRIEKRRKQLRREYRIYLLAIFLLPASFFLFQFVIQFSSGVIITDVMQSLALNAIGASVLASSYYYIYMLMQTPAGVLADRYGPRLLLTIGAIVCAIGALSFMLAHSLTLAVIGRITMGAGMSCAFVSALYLYRNWFSTRIFALLVSVLESLVITFTGVGNIVIAHVIHYTGWREFIGAIVIIAIVFAILLPLIIRNSRERKGRLRPLTDKRPTKSFLKDLKQLACNKKTFINGFYCGIMTTPQTVFVALWGIPFLVHVYGFSIIKSTVACSTLFLGIAIVGPITGALYNKTRNHHYYFAISALIVAALMTIAIFVPMNFVMLLIIFALIGMFSSTYLWNYVTIQAIAPSVSASTGIGFTNMLGMGTAPIIQLVISFVLHFVSQQHSAQHPGFLSFDYQISLAVLPILMVIAIVLGYLIKLPKEGSTESMVTIKKRK